MPYRLLAPAKLCVVCHAQATAQCPTCATLLCETHRASACADCASEALRRHRRLTNAAGLGAALIAAPLLLVAIAAAFGGASAIYLPSAVVAIWVALFSVPRVVSWLAPAKVAPELPSGEIRRLLPAAKPALNAGCDRCNRAAVCCSRCGAPRCDEHRREIRSRQTVAECIDYSICSSASARRPTAARSARPGRVKNIYATVDQ